MNRDDGPAPGAQRSVAELLAAYGAESRRDGPARSDPDARRRRAALATDTPPGATRSPAAPRSTGSGPADPRPSGDPGTNGGLDHGSSSGAGSPPRPGGGRSFDRGAPYGSPPFGTGPSRAPVYGGSSSSGASSHGSAVGDPDPYGAGGAAPSGGPVSYAREPFPSRLPSWVPVDAWGEQSRPAAPDPRERPAAESYRAPDDDETGALPTHGSTGAPVGAALAQGAPGGTATLRRAEPPAGLGRTADGTDVDPQHRPEQAHGADDSDRDAHDLYEDDDEYGEYSDYDEYDDDLADEDTARPGALEWVAVAVQVVLGALLGAVLWVGFSYLWKYLPPVALVLALVSTTGLVFGVRAMRRSDDLKTTVLAVVVGLLVTVSPAVLVLLVGSQG